MKLRSIVVHIDYVDLDMCGGCVSHVRLSINRVFVLRFVPTIYRQYSELLICWGKENGHNVSR